MLHTVNKSPFDKSSLDTCLKFAKAGSSILLIEDGVYAIDNLCSHGNARLCDGFVEGHQVECPFHQALFDVRDGSVACGPASEPVRSWPVKLEAGRVWLALDK